MWLILLYHSKWLFQGKTGSLNPLLNLLPGMCARNVCKDDYGGCQGGIVVAVAAEVY